MKPKLGPYQKAWIKTLRKGFPQGKRALCQLHPKTQEYCFCCLGVAYEVLIANGEKVKVDGSELITYNDNWSIFSSYRKFGLVDEVGRIHHIYLPPKHLFQRYSDLTDANDKGVSFLKIADAMEKYPKAFFERAV